MKVNGYALTMVRGDSEAVHVTVDGYALGSSDTVTMTARNIAHRGFMGDIRPGGTVAFSRTATITDGVAIINLQPVDTKLLADREYVYDIQLVTGTGSVHTIIPLNLLTLVDEVTR